MNGGYDAADTVLRLSLELGEKTLYLTGSGAKSLAKTLRAAWEEERKSRGPIKIRHLLQRGEDIQVFSILKKDEKTFMKEAKQWGILYCILPDQEQEGKIELLCPISQTALVNRIIEKKGFNTVEPTGKVQKGGKEAPPFDDTLSGKESKKSKERISVLKKMGEIVQNRKEGTEFIPEELLSHTTERRKER